MAKILILSVENRSKDAQKVQKVLSLAGHIIKTRLGIHETGANPRSDKGLIILELIGTAEEIKKLASKVNALKSVKTKLVEI